MLPSIQSVFTCVVDELPTVLRTAVGAMPGRKKPIEVVASRATITRSNRVRMLFGSIGSHTLGFCLAVADDRAAH